MPAYRTTCPHCHAGIRYNEKLFGQIRPCPNCSQPILLQEPGPQDATNAAAAALDNLARPAAGQGPPPASLPAAAAPETPPPLFDGPLMPERMKANRVLAGRACPECNATVELGDEVYNCQRCGATMHLGCHEKRGECARCAPASAAAAQPVEGPPPQPAAPAGTEPCRYCREPIATGALKCRYCGEFQTRSPRQGFKYRAPLNTHLVGAILVTLFCCMPFGIVAIVYAAMADGRQKSGDQAGARQMADTANTWMWLGLVGGLVVGALYMVVAAARFH